MRRSIPLRDTSTPRYRVPWAELLQKVFALDVLTCPECGGRLRLLAFITAPKVARPILDHLGLGSRAPPVARARADDESADPGPAYDCVDPSYDGE